MLQIQFKNQIEQQNKLRVANRDFLKKKPTNTNPKSKLSTSTRNNYPKLTNTNKNHATV